MLLINIIIKGTIPQLFHPSAGLFGRRFDAPQSMFQYSGCVSCLRLTSQWVLASLYSMAFRQQHARSNKRAATCDMRPVKSDMLVARSNMQPVKSDMLDMTKPHHFDVLSAQTPRLDRSVV